MGRQRDQRVIDLCLAILHDAAYLSRTERVAGKVALPLNVLHRFVADPAGLHEYWRMAQGPSEHPWQNARHGYYLIAKALRDAGWDAPVG